MKLRRTICFFIATLMLVASLALSGFADSRGFYDIYFSEENRLSYKLVGENLLKKYNAADYAVNYRISKITTSFDDYYEGKSSSTSVYSYNSSGLLSSVKSTYKNSYTASVTDTYFYDTNGNMTKHQNVEKDKEGYGYSKTAKYTYDKSGQMTKEEGNHVDIGNFSYKYNAKGLLIEKSGIEGYEKVKYSYDSAGRLIKAVKSESFSDGTTKKFTTTYTYDKSGRLVIETEPSGSKVTFKYNNNGLLTKKVYSNGNQSFKYDISNRLVEMTSKFVEDGETFTASCKYTYNKNGRLSKIVVNQHNPDGVDAETTKIIESFSYDSNENISQHKTTSVYDGEKYITTSKFSYEKISSNAAKTDDGILINGWKCTYNGKAKRPAVFIDGMNKGVDYRVSYSDNINPGKGKIIINFTDPERQSVTITFDIVLAKVSGLKATKINKTSVSLSWSKVKGAEKYLVYKYIVASKKYVNVGTTTETNIKVTGLKSATTYMFAVKAAKGSVKGAMSALVTVKTK